jgi:hypothetical protein
MSGCHRGFQGWIFGTIRINRKYYSVLDMNIDKQVPSFAVRGFASPLDSQPGAVLNPRRDGKPHPPPLMIVADEEVDFGPPDRQPPGQPQVHNDIGPAQSRKHLPFQTGERTSREPVQEPPGEIFKEEQPGERLS